MLKNHKTADFGPELSFAPVLIRLIDGEKCVGSDVSRAMNYTVNTAEMRARLINRALHR